MKNAGNDNQTMLTTGDVAVIFNVHPCTVRRWCRLGKLQSSPHNSGKHLRFQRWDIAAAYLDKSIREYLRTF
jgi:hypothetical protein